MCGRFTLAVDPDVLRDDLGVDIPDDYAPHYNIAPSQDVIAVGRGRSGLRCARFRWGLVPFWAESPRVGARMINARSETVQTRAAFRDAFVARRCLVPADGFYEWRRDDAGKQPFHIRRRDHHPFTFAGLWERWAPPGRQPLFSCTILTTAPCSLVRPIHDRMPVILDRDERARWLDPESEPSDLQALLRPYAHDTDLEAVPVSSLVNDPRNDSPACLEPVSDTPQ